MLLATLVEASAEVTALSARLAKIGVLAAALRQTGPEEAHLAVAYLSGELPQSQLGVGWASLRSLPEPADGPTLSLTDVDATCAALAAVGGAGAKLRRAELVADLFGRATAPEQQFLARLIIGELRQGAQASVLTDAVARAAEVPVGALRRAVMLRGDLPVVAAAALAGGAPALEEFRLQVGRAVEPMLAQPGATIAEAVTGEVAVEWKLDGARLQIHRDGTDVRVFTRNLNEVTARLPGVVEAIRALPVRSLVADGEVIALREDGRPHPFQVTASVFGTRTGMPEHLPLSAFVFDVLHLDGADLLDEPLRSRLATLERILPPAMQVPRLITADVAAAETFFADTIAAGHEGVMIKDLDAPYEAGRRGAAWQKIKPVHTLDLVVLAVERGSGRRSRWLSNIHLGARDEATGGFVMLGKTFKGMTDAILEWQTETFTRLATGPTDGYVVTVRPEVVVEVAVDGVQTSTRYPGGVALRFARVLRYRPDKRPDQADTLASVQALLTR